MAVPPDPSLPLWTSAILDYLISAPPQRGAILWEHPKLNVRFQKAWAALPRKAVFILGNGACDCDRQKKQDNSEITTIGFFPQPLGGAFLLCFIAF